MPDDIERLGIGEEDAALAEEEALFRMLAENVSGQRDAARLILGGEPVCFPYRGRIAGLYLLHREGAECRYAFSPRAIGPFPTAMDGLEVDEIRVGKYYPCPFCFAGTSVMDELENADAARVNELRRVLRKGRWKREFYGGFSSYAEARRATLPDEQTPVIVKNGLRLNVPADDTVLAKSTRFTIQPGRIIGELKLISPVPLDTDAGLEVCSDPRLVCRTAGRFVRTVTILDGRELLSCGRLFPLKSHKGDGYGYVLRFEYGRAILQHRPLRGEYTMDVTFTAAFIRKKTGTFHFGGRVNPTRKFVPMR